MEADHKKVQRYSVIPSDCRVDGIEWTATYIGAVVRGTMMLEEGRETGFYIVRPRRGTESLRDHPSELILVGCKGEGCGELAKFKPLPQED